MQACKLPRHSLGGLVTALLLITFANSAAAKFFQWTDEANLSHFSEFPPPASCQSTSCINIRASLDKDIGRLREEQGTLAKQREIQKRKDLVDQRRAEQDLAHQSSYLAQNTLVCATNESAERFAISGGTGGYATALLDSQKCLYLPRELTYTVIGRDLGDHTPVAIYVGDTVLNVWVTSGYVPHPLRDKWQRSVATATAN